MTRSILMILATTLLLSACKRTTPAVQVVQSKLYEVAPEPKEEVLAPTPFTADEIRAAFVAGLEVGWAHIKDDDTTYQHWRVLSADTDQMVMRFSPMQEDGTLTGTGQEQTSTWEALRKHAEFPAQQTTVSDDKIATAFGEMAVRKYEVRPKEGVVRTFWFAPVFPGPPVRHTVHESGVLTYEMQMITRVEVP